MTVAPAEIIGEFGAMAGVAVLKYCNIPNEQAVSTAPFSGRKTLSRCRTHPRDFIPLTPMRYVRWFWKLGEVCDAFDRQALYVFMWIAAHKKQAGISAEFDSGFARDLHKLKWMYRPFRYPALPAPSAR